MENQICWYLFLLTLRSNGGRVFDLETIQQINHPFTIQETPVNILSALVLAHLTVYSHLPYVVRSSYFECFR